MRNATKSTELPNDHQHQRTTSNNEDEKQTKLQWQFLSASWFKSRSQSNGADAAEGCGSLGDRAITPVVKKEKKIRLKINRLTTTNKAAADGNDC